MTIIEALSHFLDTYSNKKIAILGLGKEGLSTYTFLRRFFPTLPLYLLDQKISSQLSPEFQEIFRRDEYINTSCGKDWLDDVEIFDIIFKSPGVSQYLYPSLATAIKQNKITSNTQLFFEAIAFLKKASPNYKHLTTIGVTGTKGKSTTTVMLHHLLKTAQQQTLLGGNIGVPPLDLLVRTDEFNLTLPVYFVLELSCHQLDTATHSPNIAVVQNISPEHLDYYPDFKTYLKSKSALTKFQSIEDKVIFNPTYTTATELANLSRAEQHLFTASPDQYASLSPLKKKQVVAHCSDTQLLLNNEELLALSALPLAGDHNRENILPAVIVADLLNIQIPAIQQALLSFKGLPHRLELVASSQGTTFFNDSLATTPEATIQALDAFAGQKIILLAGGYDRSLNYAELAVKISTSSLVALVLFPDTGERILSELKKLETPLPPHAIVKSMPEAFTMVAKYHDTASIVLMSPAAASYNLFKDYADRGNQFKNQVALLIKEDTRK